MKVLILIDYRQQFWLKATHKEANYDLELMKLSFEKYGCFVEIREFSEICFRDMTYENTYVIYQSTEDWGQYYNSYIEDVLMGLKLAGAILIPDLQYFRAHNNKVFMEIMRDILASVEVKSIKSRYFGTYEEYLRKINEFSERTVVFKLSNGCQSKNVRLLINQKEKLNIPRVKTRTFNFYAWFINEVKPMLKKIYPTYRKRSNNKKKFIIQDFIDGLDGDYKILVFDKKYYVLSRKIRKNDFRASGSGFFDFVKDVPDGILDYAKKVFEEFDVPFISLDVAHKNSKFYLFEFQFVSFGTYTLEKSPFYFEQNNNCWQVVCDRSILEQEFAASIVQYINKHIDN